MLTYNTMRFSTDEFVFREPPKLRIKVPSGMTTFTLTDSQPNRPYIVLRTGDMNWYLPLATSNTSNVKIRIGNTTYSLSSA